MTTITENLAAWAQKLNTTGYPAGGLVQRVDGTPYTTATSTTTAIPVDDTIPQNTEGTEYVTVTITPKSATNKLVIRGSIDCASAVTNHQFSMALFQDSTASALAAKVLLATAGYYASGDIQHQMTAGTTSATTFKLRIGPVSTNALYINGGAGRIFGGISAVRLSVEEIAV